MGIVKIETDVIEDTVYVGLYFDGLIVKVLEDHDAEADVLDHLNLRLEHLKGDWETLTIEEATKRLWPEKKLRALQCWRNWA